MEAATKMVIELRLTRDKALFFLSLLLLAWHPGILNSEQLVLTTYYPAPYGGYVKLLTTGSAYLARDNGGVAIGPAVAGAPSQALDVNGSARFRGSLQIEGGSPAAGKMLIATNSSGGAHWGDAISGLCVYTSFSAGSTSYCGGSAMASAQYTIVGYTNTSGNLPIFSQHDHVDDLFSNSYGQGTEMQSGYLICCRII